VLTDLADLGGIGPGEDVQKSAIHAVLIEGNEVGLVEFGKGVPGIVAGDGEVLYRFERNPARRPVVVPRIDIPARERKDGYGVGVVALAGEVAVGVVYRHQRPEVAGDPGAVGRSALADAGSRAAVVVGVRHRHVQVDVQPGGQVGIYLQVRGIPFIQLVG